MASDTSATNTLGAVLDGAALFSTDRLLCRRWRPTDEAALLEIYGDPVGARWVGDGQPITPEECAAWLRVTANNYQQRGYGMFALEDVNSTQVVGFAGLVHPDNQIDPELKYAFQRSSWGAGLASEIAPALVAYGRNAFGMQRVIATVAAQNLPSQRVLVRAGMRFQGVDFGDSDGTTFVYAC